MGEYGLVVLERIAKMWVEGVGGGGFRSIRDAMGWVSRALGPDEFKRKSLTVERMLCEATMVLMVSTHRLRLPSYDADMDVDSVGCRWALQWRALPIGWVARPCPATRTV